MTLRNVYGYDIVTNALGVNGGDGAAIWASANMAHYYISLGSGTISKIAVNVVATSGNISVGVYSSTGTGRDRVPATRIATSGAVACPANGFREIALLAPVYVDTTCFLAISCDNGTASFTGGSGTDAVDLYKGQVYKAATQHPLPTSPGTLSTTHFRMAILVGVA